MGSGRRIGTLALAFLVAGCSAEVAAPRSTAAPSASARATDAPRPTNASNDLIFVRSSGGPSPAIVAVDARTGKTLRTMRDGALTADAKSVYWSESVSGGTRTALHLTDLASGAEIRSFTIDGDLRPAGNAQMFDPVGGEARLTSDGRYLAMMNVPYKLNGEWLTKIAVVDTVAGTLAASTELRGQNTYGFLAIAPDGRSLFLEQYGEGATRTRVFDLAAGTLTDATGPGLATNGFRTAGVLSADGRWLFRIDAGSQTTNCTSTDGPACVPNGTPPYVVAIDLVSRRAAQIRLSPAHSSPDFEKNMLWSLALTKDGSTLYAVNPALGVIDELDVRSLSLRRSGLIAITRQGGDALAAIARFLFPVAEAKRYVIAGAVLSPDGRTLYAAGFMGLAVIETELLTTRAYWERMNRQFDTLRLSPDGRRLYAMDNVNGKLVMFDSATGSILGEIGLPYVPAILRIDAVP